MEVCAWFELIAIENATALGDDVLEIGKRGEVLVGEWLVEDGPEVFSRLRLVACEKGRLGAQAAVGVERPRFGWSKRATQRRTRKAPSQARRSRRLWPAAARMALIASP